MVEGNEMRMLSLMRAGLTRRQLLRGMGLSVAAVATTGLLAACEVDDDTETEVVDDADDDEAAGVDLDDDHDDDHDDDAETDDEVVDDDDHDDHDDHADDDEAAADEDRPHIVVGMNSMISDLDANSNASLVGFMTQYNIFEMLFRRDFLDSDPVGTGNTLEPGLATDWEFIDDTTLEVRLREDVTFHNGDHMDADDVVFTFERIFDQDIPELSTARGDLGTISEVEKVDDYTVRFHTDGPDPLLEMRLAVRVSWIIPQNYYEEVGMDEFGLNPVGTGPYRVVSFTPDEEIVTEAFDDYWKETPNLSGYTMRLIPETAARVSALASGEIHIATALPPDQLETVENTDGVHIKSVESLNFHMMRFNCHHPHVEDARIRRALCHAIDRQLLVDTLWFGEARVPAGHQFVDYPEHLTFDLELPYDPDLAMELMEEAGYDDELITFRVHPTYYTGYADAAQAIIEMWREVGFNAEIELTEEPWEADEDAMVHNWSNSSHMADPAGAQWTNWGAGGPAQENFWDAPDEYNELGEEQLRTIDDDRRSEIWERMNEIWLEERPGTPMYNPLESYGVSDNISWEPYSLPYFDFRNYNMIVHNDD
ncbi:MAG: oligopeptide ABC transporter substrate-binding protein [Sphaerobacteraceae bacterium]|nr:MAG: oligopeptide ABC transporter substrate-binding protein [Sphaerobacteraceae bacterium]